MDDRQNPFVIDASRLDLEWLRQAQLARAAGRQHADAEHALAQAKAVLTVTKARVLLEVRKQPEVFGLRPKPNEAEVDAAVDLDARVTTALEAYQTAERDVGYAKADVIAFVDRRKALENYVRLLELDYVSEREPRPVGERARQNYQNDQRRDVLGGGVEIGDDTVSSE